MSRIIRIDNDGSWVYVERFEVLKGGIYGNYALSVTFNQSEAEEMSHIRAIAICGYLASEAGFVAEPRKKRLAEFAELD